MKKQYHSKYTRDIQLTRNAYEEWGTERRIYPDRNKLRLASLSFQKRGFRIEMRSPAPHYDYFYNGAAYLSGWVGDYELTIYFHVNEKGQRVP